MLPRIGGRHLHDPVQVIEQAQGVLLNGLDPEQDLVVGGQQRGQLGHTTPDAIAERALTEARAETVPASISSGFDGDGPAESAAAIAIIGRGFGREVLDLLPSSLSRIRKEIRITTPFYGFLASGIFSKITSNPVADGLSQFRLVLRLIPKASAKSTRTESSNDTCNATGRRHQLQH